MVCLALFEKDPSEGASEVFVKDGVDDWVESWIHVAEPEGDGKGRIRYLAPIASRNQDVEEEEG